jgi:hypothetical protein
MVERHCFWFRPIMFFFAILTRSLLFLLFQCISDLVLFTQLLSTGSADTRLRTDRDLRLYVGYAAQSSVVLPDKSHSWRVTKRLCMRLCLASLEKSSFGQFETTWTIHQREMIGQDRETIDTAGRPLRHSYRLPWLSVHPI